MTEKYEYCSTVPKTFVQDCLNPGFGEKSLFSSFFLPFLETSRLLHARRMTFETILSTRQFRYLSYRAHSPKLEPSTAEVGRARSSVHCARAQYSVAKTQCIINIRYKLTKKHG